MRSFAVILLAPIFISKARISSGSSAFLSSFPPTQRPAAFKTRKAAFGTLSDFT
jgi:hypothetical protein